MTKTIANANSSLERKRQDLQACRPNKSARLRLPLLLMFGF